MVKMILTVPQGFNAELFCNAATAMVKDAAENEYERRCYDYTLGEMLRPHFTKDVWYLGGGEYFTPIWKKIENAKKPAPLAEEYEVNADFVDLAHLDALRRLQSICPQVELHFENCGDETNSRTVYDKDYFDENYTELFVSKSGMTQKKLA